MKKYVSKLLEETTRDLDSTAKMPAANHLFNVNADRNKTAPRQIRTIPSPGGKTTVLM